MYECYFQKFPEIIILLKFLRKMNLLGIWQMQKIEQVYAVPNPTLPAPETFNFLFKKRDLLQKRENLHAALVPQVLRSELFH